MLHGVSSYGIAPFSMNGDVHVGSRHAGRDRGVLGAPGGHWVAGIALARWLQLVVAAPRNLCANVSMVSQHSQYLTCPLNCRID